RSRYVGSAGVRKGELDPFAVAAMAEIGIDISRHKPVTFEELDEWEGLNFDLIVTLAPEAHHRALELTRVSGVEVEYWPTADPSAVEGSREQRLDAYRAVRDQLLARIRERFAGPRPGNDDNSATSASCGMARHPLGSAPILAGISVMVAARCQQSRSANGERRAV